MAYAPNRVSGTVRVIRIAWSVDCSVDSLVVKYRNAYQSVFNYSQLQQRRGQSNPSLRSPRTHLELAAMPSNDGRSLHPVHTRPHNNEKDRRESTAPTT